MPPHVTYPYTGRLILRLSKTIVDQIVQRALAHAPDFQNLEQVAAEIPLDALGALLPTGSVSSPVTAGFPLRRVLELEDGAGHSPFRPVHRLAGYYVLDPRGVLNMVDTRRLLTQLKALATAGLEVDHVYREPELRDAAAGAVNPGDDPYFGQQGYLKGGVSGPHAYRGINVDNAAVWGSYNGSGIGLVDLETGWNLAHEDLPVAAHAVYNNNRFDPANYNYGDHGTAVLGIVLGQDNAIGIVGVAPKASLRRVVSRVKSATDEWDIVGAVLAALEPGVMALGDVLLLEVETVVGNPIRGYPVEIVDHWFDAIRLAVGNGMVVVEAAGNGITDAYGNEIGRNLDQLEVDWPDAPTWRSLNRSRAAFLDSGAIVVSACRSAVAPPAAHRRMPFASYGSRVDCYAWGENVFTAGWGLVEGSEGDINTWYTDLFNGTSSASAIIAGAAILVQQMHTQTAGWRLMPAQVRALLSDQASGVKIVDTTGTAQIGVMPDLARVAARIPSVPDIFIRDSVVDSGAVPNSLVFQSPDIILRSTQSSNPGGEYGQGSPLADAMPPNEPVRQNVPNYIYVRMRNRSPASAAGVRATVYWSEASPLVAPVHWNRIGSTVPITVPGDGALTVAGPLVWTPLPGNLPVSNHGCFVAVLDHPLDPAPPLLPPDPNTGATTTWEMFLAYVGRHNNVAWRNFSVLQTDAAGAAEAFFQLRGPGDRPRMFTIQVLKMLQKGARVWWEVPRELAELMRRSPDFPIEGQEETTGGVRLLLTGKRALRFPGIELGPSEAYPCSLHVQVPRGKVLAGNQIIVQQLLRGTEVGRITWIIQGGESAVG